MDSAISPYVKTLAGQQDVSVRLLPRGSSRITIPKITTGRLRDAGGEFIPPIYLVDEIINRDLRDQYLRSQAGVLGSHRPKRKRQTPRRTPSYRERQRRARAATQAA